MKWEHNGHVYETENPVLVQMYDEDETFVRVEDKAEEKPKQTRTKKK